jgi:hypothetical protein
MTPASPVLYVAWRDPRSRKILPVARLLRLEDGEYEFVYVKGIEEAEKVGFEPFLAFPERNVAYRSETLPPFFSNRVMSSSRPDFEEYVRNLGLEGVTEPFTVLAANDGRRSTDQVEVFPDLRADRAGRVYGRFLVRAVRHVANAEERIKSAATGDRLYCVRDVQNEHNASAIALRTQEHAIVGYCPDYLAQRVTLLLEQDPELLVTIERINPPPAPVHHRLLVSLKAQIHGAEPPLEPRYEPVVAATPLPSPVESVP